MKIELTLKNTRLKSYDVMSWIIVILNFIAQLAFTFIPDYARDRFLPYIILILALLLLISDRRGRLNFSAEKENTHMMIASICAICIRVSICIIWIRWELYWIAALNVIFYLLYIYAIKKIEVIVSEKQISYPSFPKRQVEWSELQNIMVKDGILTIDFKNNKLLQAEIEGEDSFDEKKFNDFCREQLTK